MKYYRLVDSTYEQQDCLINTEVADVSQRMRRSLELAPIFKLILEFWSEQKVSLITACNTVILKDIYLPYVQKIEIDGGNVIPTYLLYSQEKIKKVSLLSIKKVIFPYIDYYQKTGISLSSNDIPYIWEYFLEVYRKSFCSNKVSRFSSIFLFGKIDDMINFELENHQFEGLTQCECSLSNIKHIEKHDMRWINEIPENCLFTEFCDYAKSYWNGELTTNPIIEYLFSGEYILSKV